MTNKTDVTETKPEQFTYVPAVQKDSESDGLMNLVTRMALDPAIDPDRIDRAFAMYKEVKEMETMKAFNQAMASAQAEIQPVATNKQNDHTKSQFANLSAVHEVCKPIWTKHGFAITTSFYEVAKENWVGIDCEVMHSSGHTKRYRNPFPLDNAGTNGTKNKTSIQAMGSTGSYARRYTELMVFDVSIASDDNDGQPVDHSKKEGSSPALLTITTAMALNLRNAMKIANVDEAYVCKAGNLKRLEDLQQGRMAGMLAHLKTITEKGAQ